MTSHDTARSPQLLPIFFRLLAGSRTAVQQERVFLRLVHLTVGVMLNLGRQTQSHVLVTLGLGAEDWSAWYRVFNRSRVRLARLHEQVVDEVCQIVPAGDAVLAVVVDGTQLPRTSRRLPGCGFARHPRTPFWRRGIHLAQRYVGLSVLLPRSEQGDSRAVPVRWLLLRTAKTTPMGAEPERSETSGALELLHWLRTAWDARGRMTQPLLVLGDGSYSTAPVLAQLPERTILLARCAKNRALYALPTYRTQGRGRQPRYGTRGPTPQQHLHIRRGWHRVPFLVRGRRVDPLVQVSGPWLVKGAPFCPVVLLAVRGVDRGRGCTRRQRDPSFFLVTIAMNSEDDWAVPLPVAELLAWAWQRWEVEVMHRELKSGFGLGQQHAFSDPGAAGVIAWMVWSYALLILTGYLTWGLGPGSGPPLGRWWQPRRWSIGSLVQHLRAELWQAGDFQPVWQRTPDTWGEITHWLATQTNAPLGTRRI